MINSEFETVTEEISNTIDAWLVHSGRNEVANLVRHRIAALESEAVNCAIQNPLGFIANGDVSQAAKKKLEEAAQWKIFLEKMSEFAGKDFKRRTVKLSTG